MAEVNEQSIVSEILPAEPADLAIISELVDRSYQTPYKPGGLANRALDTEEKLEQEIAEGTKILIIKKDGVIVGSNRYRMEGDGVCHLTRLAVAPEFRNQGIGSMLVKKTLAEAKNEGALLARLECMEEKELVPYYETFGFQVVEKNPHGKHTIVTMEKKID